MPERLKQVRQVFLDMDGTIYKGATLFPCTIPFLDFLRARSVGYAFLSNNSSVCTEAYVRKLRGMGIEATEKNFYTSTNYTIDFLKSNFPEIRRLFLLGVPEIVPEFEAAGFRLDGETPQAVVVAFDKTLDYAKLCRAAWFLKCGIPGFATHPDVFCPSDKQEWLVDCGAITACLERSTGVALTVLGKPCPGLLKNAARNRGITDMREVLMVGDRLSTDIAVGVNAGALTCHIADASSDVLPVKGIVPDYSVADLSGLLRLWQNGTKGEPGKREGE